MTARCRSCNAEIDFVRTNRGGWMPLDVEPSEHGNIRIEGEVAFVLARGALSAARRSGVPLRISHFATCPRAEQHRRR